jgi:PAS domain S-box-containing protein/putative nucleotidyltransferase with HDIG domain
VEDVATYLLRDRQAFADCLRSVVVLNVNRAAVALYDARSSEDLIERCDEMDLRESPRNLRRFWHAMAIGERTATFEISVSTLAGRRIHVRETCMAAPGHEETFDRVFVADIDITDLKKAEAAARRTQSAIETASDDFYSVTPEGRFTYVNRAAARSLGRSQEELIGMAPWEISPSITAGGWQAHWQKLCREGELRFESVHQAADGHLFPVEITASHVVLDDGEYEFTHVRDITQRKRAERELAESEARYRSIVETSAEGVAVLDEQRRFRYVNEQLCRLSAYSSSDLVGKVLDGFLYPDDLPALSRQWKDRKEGKVGRYEMRLRREDGSARWVMISSRPVTNHQGEFAGTISMVTDMHDRKLAEERARRTVERLRRSTDAAVKTLARTIELRDPYTAGHQERVTELAVVIGRRLGLPRRALTALRIAALIHDLGKIAVPAEILSKPGSLSDMERQLIHRHPETGFQILREMRFPGPVATIVRQHHERCDGTGYPAGLRGGQIRMESRIIAVADVVEAMASHRPYRAALGIDAALAEIESGKGALYDSTVVETCLAIFREEGFSFSEQQ